MKCIVHSEACILFGCLCLMPAAAFFFFNPSWYLCHLEMELLSNTPTFTLMFMHVECFTLLNANLILPTNGWQSETFGEATGFVLRATRHS